MPIDVVSRFKKAVKPECLTQKTDDTQAEFKATGYGGFGFTATEQNKIVPGQEISTAETGLVSLWHLSEGTGTTANDSKGTNHGTIYGATWVNGKLGYALDFDGTDDRVDLGSPASLAVTVFTLEAWFKLDAKAVDDFTHRSVLARYKSWSLVGNSWPSLQAIVSIFDGTSWYIYKSNVETEINKWYHLVAVRTAANDLYIYVNGKRTASYSNAAAPSTATQPVEIGHTPTEAANWFDGIIDEVAVYNTALSEETIISRYNSHITNLYRSPRWDLGVNTKPYSLTFTKTDPLPTGTDLKCFARSGSTTESAGTAWETSTPRLGNASGKFQGDDYVNCGNDASLDISAALTIEAWVRINNDTTTMAIAGKMIENTVTGQGGYYFSVRNGYPRLYIRNYGGLHQHVLESPIKLTVGSWHHVATTFNSSTIAIYIDGQLRKSEAPNISAIGTSTTAQNFLIGVDPRTGTGSFFNGAIDEVAVFNAALSAPTILQHYEAGSPATSSTYESSIIDMGEGKSFDADAVLIHSDIPDATGFSLQLQVRSGTPVTLTGTAISGIIAKYTNPDHPTTADGTLKFTLPNKLQWQDGSQPTPKFGKEIIIEAGKTYQVPDGNIPTNLRIDTGNGC